MPPSTERVGFLVWLFGFGADVAARRAIDRQLAHLDETTCAIKRDHELDTLVEGIEALRTEGVAAMGDGDG